MLGRRLVLGCSVIAIAAAALVGGCASRPVAGSATDVLSRSAASIASLKSGTYASKMTWLSPDLKEISSMAGSGSFSGDDWEFALTEVTGPGGSETSHGLYWAVRVVDGVRYRAQPLTQEAAKNPQFSVDVYPGEYYVWAASTQLGLLRGTEVAQDLGVEDVRGVSCRRIQLEIEPGDLAEAWRAPGASADASDTAEMRKGDILVEAWIGVDDAIPYRLTVELSAEFEGVSGAVVRFTHDYAGFNEPVKVEAPKTDR